MTTSRRITQAMAMFVMVLLCALTQPLHAQVTVEAKIDSLAIFIGQQAHMTVSVTAPERAHVAWPNYKYAQPLMPGIEVLGSTKAETESQGDGTKQVTRRFTLTSFDERVYAIPGMKVRVDGKFYQANTTALKVVTMEVDTLHPNQFFPPKAVQDNPFRWSEWSGVFLLSLLVLLLLAAAVWLAVRLHQNKPIIAHIKIVRRLPAHQKALNAIDRIKSEHLQQSQDQKQYYTALTDALRQYINDRFGFNAKEMTSEEIIARLQQSGDKQMIDELKELFRTADLVKFAKYSTLLGENDMNLVNAVNFIDKTKLDTKPTEERIVPKLSETDRRSNQTRLFIKTAALAAGVAGTALLVYTIVALLQLLGLL